MTNPRKEIITIWTTLKAQILSLKPFLKNKALIIEAVKLHLLQSSSFTSENSHEPLLNRRSIEQTKKRLTKELEQLIRQQEQEQEEHALGEESKKYFESEKERIRKELTKLEVALTESSTVQTAFTSQKTKNEQIVRECQELLAQLNQINNHD